MRKRLAVLGWVVLGWFCSLPSLQAADAAKDDANLRRLGVTRGICVLLGDKECRLAFDLARRSELTLYVQLPTPPRSSRGRGRPTRPGCYGTRIFVEKGTPARIGLADNVADAVWSSATPAGVDEARSAPRAAARRQGDSRQPAEHGIKPFPTGVDDWSHHYHGPDNNPQSLDQLARAPYLTQFIAEPRYAPAPQAAVAAGGRLFMAFGHVAWHEREEPWLEHARGRQRLQRHAALEAAADAGHHGRPQHDDRHARDALPGRRQVVQAARRGHRQARATRSSRPPS